MNPQPNRVELIAPPSDRGSRLDRWVVLHCPQLSRARVQQLIDAGLVLVNGSPAKAAHKLRGGERVLVEPRERPPLRAEPEAIPLQILYEDDDLLLINKPAGMSVHAGAGNARGTLVNALLGRGQALSRGGGGVADDLRPGIVHRLDKDTSGVIVIAKNDFAHARMAVAFRTRTVTKIYLALVEGQLPAARGRIEFPIGRDPVRRTRMKAFTGHTQAGRGPAARQALTEWRKLADLGSATLLEVQLHTGRTHQIRVHFSALKHPLVGDTLYGGPSHLRIGNAALPPPARQFLHSSSLAFPHPRTGAWVEARAPLPADLREYLEQLATAGRYDFAAAAPFL